MEITFYGHSCFGVQLFGKHLLFDPYISPNKLAKHIDINVIAADYIFLSHGHEDHIADVIEIGLRTNAKIICSFEIYSWLTKKGLTNFHPTNVGGKVAFEFGSVKCVNAVHSNSLPDGSYGGNSMGFVIESLAGNFYYAGDTALTYDMKLIGDYRKINFAFLPIGDNFTMGVDNAIICSEFINCPNIIGMHFNTFDLIKIDQEYSIKKFEQVGKKLTLLKIGETITI